MKCVRRQVYSRGGKKPSYNFSGTRLIHASGGGKQHTRPEKKIKTQTKEIRLKGSSGKKLKGELVRFGGEKQ